MIYLITNSNITTTVEGLERYPVNLRYARELRDDLPSLRAVLVPTPGGQQIPLGQLAQLEYAVGPPGIKSENAKPNAWIYVDISNIDVGTYVERAQKVVAEKIQIPPGYTIVWSGQYEYMQRAQKRLMYVVPVTLVLIFVIIYLSTGSIAETGLVMLGVPFALIGSVWLLWWLDYNMSVAVWVGFIALAGLYAETAIVLLLYLDQSYNDSKAQGLITDRNSLIEAIYRGSVQRVRPILMTVATDVIGLLPIMWSTGTGSEVMKRIATPLVGGIMTSGFTVLVIFPVVYYLWRSRGLPKGERFTGFRKLEETS